MFATITREMSNATDAGGLGILNVTVPKHAINNVNKDLELLVGSKSGVPYTTRGCTAMQSAIHKQA